MRNYFRIKSNFNNLIVQYYAEDAEKVLGKVLSRIFIYEAAETQIDI